MYLNYLANLGHYVPELLTCLTMFVLILLESTYGRTEKKRTLFYTCTFLGLGTVLISLCQNFSTNPMTIFTNTIAIDPFSTMVKIILVLGTLGAVYLSRYSKDLDNELKAEFTILSIGILVGGMLLTSAANMLILYIGIETLSILSYALAAMRKNDEKSAEAGLKYALYGGITAGIMLFGISHIYGLTGTLYFSELGEALANLTGTQMAIVLPAFLLFFAGIGYKIACIPFHMWSPDVYEGSPFPVTTFFAIVPKIAGMAAIIRISHIFFNTEGILQNSWIGLLAVIAALTMTVGNVSAIGQKSIKRMLAYSSIGHAGVMLMGALVIDKIGIQSVLFYGVVYLFMTLTAFYIVSFVNDEYGNDDFERFNGFVFHHPLMAGILAIVMFSLAGLPPFGGFIAKFNILAAIVQEQHYTLGVIAVINSLISLYFYLRLVRLMFLKPVEGIGVISGFGYVHQGLICTLAIPVVLLGIFWAPLIELVSGAKILVWP